LTTDLTDYGWNSDWQVKIPKSESGMIYGRIIRHDLAGYQLLTEDGTYLGILPGRVRQRARSKAQLPAVGDWVLATPISGDKEKLMITQVLPRKSRFSRNESGERTDEQVVASNIDLVFIVSGLDHNFSPARIERFLLLARESGALPIVLLNKADLSSPEEIDQHIKELEPILGNIPVLVTSVVTSTGIEHLQSLIPHGQTAAFLGSSGVGKSSIINSLLDEERLKTSAVRIIDSKGRHTTSHRELVLMPSGGLLIDTPGMRELQVWADEDAVDQSFEDILSVTDQCRFRDCQHQSEPGCAVKDAVLTGKLSVERVERYLQYREEVAALEARQRQKLARASKRKPRPAPPTK